MLSPELKNAIATGHNLLCRWDALKGGAETRGWGGEKWAHFCDKMEDFRAALTTAKGSPEMVREYEVQERARKAGPTIGNDPLSQHDPLGSAY